MEEAVKQLTDIPAINRFLSYCRIRTVTSKTVVIHAGDLPDVLYYVISGSVEVMIEDEEGNEMLLPKSEQIPTDYFKKGETVRGVVKKVELKNSQAVIFISRTSPLFLEKLLEIEEKKKMKRMWAAT